MHNGRRVFPEVAWCFAPLFYPQVATMLHADSMGSLSRAPMSQTSVFSGNGQLGQSTQHLKEMPQGMFKHVGFAFGSSSAFCEMLFAFLRV